MDIDKFVKANDLNQKILNSEYNLRTIEEMIEEYGETKRMRAEVGFGNVLVLNKSTANTILTLLKSDAKAELSRLENEFDEL